MKSKKKVQICIVVGGGNIFRGVAGASQGIERGTADSMGMLATVINAMAIQNSIEKNNVSSRVLSAVPMPQGDSTSSDDEADVAEVLREMRQPHSGKAQLHLLVSA